MPAIRIEKLVYQGYGLARGSDKTLFVPRTAPGDLVDIRIVERRKSFDLAAVETLLEASPSRIDPPCPVFMAGCGGCQWQHLDYASQLQWKENIFVEFLRRNRFPEPLPGIDVRASSPFGYRTRFHFHLDVNRRAALFRERSRQHVAVDRCLLLPDPLNDLLSRIQEQSWMGGCESFQIWQDDLGAVGLETTPCLPEAHLDSVRREIPGLRLLHPASPDRMEYRVRQFRFLLGAGSFYQTNRFLNNSLNDTVATLAGCGSALLDLYSGIGFFAIPLGERFTRVVGVEENVSTADEAIENARLNGVASVEFVPARTEDFLERNTESFECLLADPPRAGLSRRTIAGILEMKPSRLVYVSCDPATLVRDVLWLGASYRVRQFILFDLFPQTFHFEVVAELEMRN